MNHDRDLCRVFALWTLDEVYHKSYIYNLALLKDDHTLASQYHIFLDDNYFPRPSSDYMVYKYSHRRLCAHKFGQNFDQIFPYIYSRLSMAASYIPWFITADILVLWVLKISDF